MTNRFWNGAGLEEIPVDATKNLRALMKAQPWKESAEQLISDILSVTTACTARQLPIIEIQEFCLSLRISIRVLLELLELKDRPQGEVLMRLMAAMLDLDLALRDRAMDHSVNGQYAEARVSSRRAMSENHDPVLDRFPELVELSVEVCSHEVAAYMVNEVQLPNDMLLDVLGMLARDRAEPDKVSNPPARIRVALSRKRQRRQRLERERWTQLTRAQINGLEDLNNVESMTIATVDWERGKNALELPPDQTRAVEARIHGFDLQAPDARTYLGWDAAHLGNVRRSLEPDRRWGKRLRKRFSAYDPARSS
jgi:hypothetical protein